MKSAVQSEQADHHTNVAAANANQLCLVTPVAGSVCNVE